MKSVNNKYTIQKFNEFKINLIKVVKIVYKKKVVIQYLSYFYEQKHMINLQKTCTDIEIN